MPIKRSQFQSDESLEEFYNRKEWTGAFKLVAHKMLTLIKWINENFKETNLTASTLIKDYVVVKHVFRFLPTEKKINLETEYSLIV